GAGAADRGGVARAAGRAGAAARRGAAALDRRGSLAEDPGDACDRERRRRTAGCGALSARARGIRAVPAGVDGNRGSVPPAPAVHEETVRELEEAEKQLSRKLAEIRRSHPALSSPEILLKASIRRARGKLPFPVDGGGRIEAHFGRAVDPRFGTVTLQTGIDVRAPTGTPVRAVWDGKIAHAGWFRGFGNLLIVDHGGGVFSLMAHLDQLQKALGDAVRAGEQVGTVGETGSLKGPYLY